MSLQPIKPDADFDTRISTLGPAGRPSPAQYGHFVSEGDRILYDLDPVRIAQRLRDGREPLSFERAGPRERIFFDPARLTAAVVTCGGLCPGLNDVVRAIVHQLHYLYGVRRILGIRYGYAGLNPAAAPPPIELTPDTVRTVHEDGGTFLGSSRGEQPVPTMVDTLVSQGIGLLFTIGGDGTLRGAGALVEEITRRGLPIAVVGVPKTIDNDIELVSRTFGFDSAVEAAADVLRCAHAEAVGAQNGIGIVRLMGRESGFVAAHAALAQGDANFVLVPEVPFELEGPAGLLACLEARLQRRGHALLVVAEGAGQQLFGADLGADASGNRRPGDIGALLRDRIHHHLSGRGLEHSIKYIDPSYIVRSVPANANDSIFCNFMGQHAVHAGLAGRTGLLVGSWNNRFVHVPLAPAIRQRKRINPAGTLWLSVLESTGQPERMVAAQ